MKLGLLRVLLAAVAALAGVLPAGPLRPGTPPLHAAALPSGLPSHFGIGITAAPAVTGLTGWMPSSSIPWDYAYTYLAGGVNTGGGWETWNTGGQYPLWYAQSAASHNYIPFFPYYELLQSSGSCGSCGEAQRDLSNLNNAGLMASYYQNFALLMKRLGPGTYDGIAGFGKTAVVQVEPDFTGGHAEQAVLNTSQCFGYCSGQGNNPALLKASVASSGVADVAAYPNTFQGFNWALLHLRDRYAPNVLLAFHVSNWATGSDIGSSTSALDANALGQEAGSFAAQSGIAGVPAGTSSYDLLTNDVLDRDAGYYKYVYGNPSVWWDRLNVTFPNFHRWESYLSAAHVAAGRSFFIWQIPEGNQYFDTENNTDGHYQDNRAEYFFTHIGELVQSGVIGLLFGSGNGGSTVHWDGKNDGITNPASRCTSDGLSSGQVCNNHTSTVADDDGGYLRMAAQQYYAGGGYPLGGATSTATPTPAATQTPLPSATSTRVVPPTASATKVMPPTPSRTVVAPTASATRVASPTASATAGTLHVTVTGPSAAPAQVAWGGSESLTATVQTTLPLSNAVVDYEVYSSAGAKVFQWFASGQTFAAGAPRSFSAAWSVPASQTTGTYTFKIGVFGAGWTPLYVWNNAAATFTVK